MTSQEWLKKQKYHDQAKNEANLPYDSEVSLTVEKADVKEDLFSDMKFDFDSHDQPNCPIEIDFVSGDYDQVEKKSISDTPRPVLRVPKPTVNFLRAIKIEVKGQLLNTKDFNLNEVLSELIEEKRLILPDKIMSQNSRLASSHSLSYIQGEGYLTCYEYLKALLADQTVHEAQLIDVLTSILKALATLEDAGCPPINLNHEQVYYNIEDKYFQVLATTETNYHWPVVAANLIVHCLFLCGDMAGEEPVSPQEHLEISDVLLNTDLITPHEHRILQRALNGTYNRIDELINALQNSKKLNGQSLESQVQEVARIAVQKVGQHKYQKKAMSFLSTDAQQEDRYFDTCFTINEKRYWLAVVFDGVSTCDFGSGADIAEICRIAIQRVTSRLQFSKELCRVLDYHQDPTVILDFITQHLIKAVLVRLDELKDEFDLTIRSQELSLPTSTMTMALMNEQGKVYFKWLGDSPALIVNEQGKVQNILFAHSLKNYLILEGEFIDVALNHTNKNALVSDVSHLATESDITIGHGEYQLRKDDILILCSDGLLDGFKTNPPPFGADVYALDQIEEWLASKPEYLEKSNLYRMVNDLCVEADLRNGVDNITALALRPNWLVSF